MPWPTAMPSSLSEATYLLLRLGIQAVGYRTRETRQAPVEHRSRGKRPQTPWSNRSRTRTCAGTCVSCPSSNGGPVEISPRQGDPSMEPPCRDKTYHQEIARRTGCPDRIESPLQRIVRQKGRFSRWASSNTRRHHSGDSIVTWAFLPSGRLFLAG